MIHVILKRNENKWPKGLGESNKVWSKTKEIFALSKQIKRTIFFFIKIKKYGEFILTKLLKIKAIEKF